VHTWAIPSSEKRIESLMVVAEEVNDSTRRSETWRYVKLISYNQQEDLFGVSVVQWMEKRVERC
jgi:hypothetical protein